MLNLAYLTVQARETAMYRGHLLGTFTSQGEEASATCSRCDKTINVSFTPTHDGLSPTPQITGEVANTNCAKRNSIYPTQES
jgi:hypothetical protein